MLDLSNAYLQIRVDPSMWRYQSCIINGKRFALTRMDFGLNTAPVVMSEIVKRILNFDKLIEGATSSYIDDIFVDESIVSADQVKELFTKFGLMCKDPERPNSMNEIRILGLNISQRNDILRWKRANKVRLILIINGRDAKFIQYVAN